MNSLKFANSLGIKVIDHEKEIIYYIPNGQIHQNIPTIWKMLKYPLQDWNSAAAIKSLLNNAKSEEERISLWMDLVEQLKPRLYQCMFSYIIIFFILENGYHFAFSELNLLNKELNLRLLHDKAPRRTNLINNLWKIRNYSIAHWVDTEKKQFIDSITRQSWGYACGIKSVREWELEFLEPGIPDVPMCSIPEIDEECCKYLSRFDEVCYQYLISIIAELPIKKGSIEYLNPLKR